MTKEFVGYAFQKTLATGFIDMALLLANVSQLKILTEQEIFRPNFKTICAIFLVVVSIMLQVAVGCILIYLGKEENKAMSNFIVVTNDKDNESNSGNSASTGDTILNMVVPRTYNSQPKSFPEIYKLRNEIMTSVPDITSNTINEMDQPAETNKMLNGTDDVDNVSVLGHDEVDGIYVIDRDANTIHAIRQHSRTPSRVSPTDTLDRNANIESGTLGQPDQIGDIHKKHSNKNAHVMCCVFIIMIINIVLSGMGLGLSDGQAIPALSNGTNS